MPYLSVVIPVYNSARTIGPLVEALLRDLRDTDVQIVLVNDGSRDDSEAVCMELARRFPVVDAIALRRNFGEFNAVLCGLSYARGTFGVLIDDDFQNPPGEIRKLLHTAEVGGYDVVYSFYIRKQHSTFRNVGSWLVNRLTTWLLDKPADLYLSSFKLIRREVVRELVRYQGPYPYLDGLIFRVTRNVGRAEVQHAARREGRSNYTFSKLLSLFLTILLGYSVRPLRLLSVAGLGLLGLAAGLGVLSLLGSWSLLPSRTDPLLLLTLLLLGGLHLLGLGLLGEYIGKLFMHQSGLPPYVVKAVSQNASPAP